MTSLRRPTQHRSRASTSALERFVAVAVMSLMLVAWSSTASASSVAKQVLQHVNVDEKLDVPLPAGAQFLDHTGKAVRLGDVVGRGKPTLLVLAYHSCPVLCGMVQSAAATALKAVKWTAGKEFEVVVLSIDPRDTPARAAEKRAAILTGYGRPEAANGFHFLVGAKPEIDRVADAIGFKYEYDAEQQQYGHPAVIMFVKPTGEMSRYLYGLEYDPNDVRIALYEAANGKSIGALEKVILYCYQYNPHDGKYVVMATRVMKLGGALTVLVLGAFLSLMWAQERRRSRAAVANVLVPVPDPTGSSTVSTHVSPL